MIDEKISSICVWNVLFMIVSQGRTLGESTAGRRRRRSFMPPSFFEDDTADFPDDLDTSFFTRVSSGHTLPKRLLVTVTLVWIHRSIKLAFYVQYNYFLQHNFQFCNLVNAIARRDCLFLWNKLKILSTVYLWDDSSLPSRLCRKACRMSCPAMLTRFLRLHRRLPSNSWMRASSREALWIGMN